MKNFAIIVASLIGVLATSCLDHDIENPKPEVEVMAWRAGGTAADEGRSIATDATGNVYVAGNFFNTITLGNTTLTSAGNRDGFVVKYNKNGEVQWARSVGGPGTESASSIAVDGSGNVFVSGFFNNSISIGTTTLTSGGLEDIFVAKFNSTGDVQWARSGGGTDRDYGNVLALDGSGHVYVAGNFSGIASFGTTTLTAPDGSGDAYIAKYNSNGTLEWAKNYGGTGGQNIQGITIDGSGTIYITGFFTTSATFGSTTLTAAGSTNSLRTDIFTAKLTNSGDVQWAKGAGGSGNETSLDIAVDGNGNSYITGYLTGLPAIFGSTTLTPIGSTDLFVAKYNSNGDLQWAKLEGGTGADLAESIDVDASGHAYVTGYFSGNATFGATSLTSVGDSDVLVIKYNANGEVQWAKSAGGAGQDMGRAIAVKGTGKAHVTGTFKEAATFGPTPLTSSGDSDVFIAKF
jgi:secreted PhoX family phosphatase